MWDDDLREDEKRTILQNVALHVAANRDAVLTHWRFAKVQYPDLTAALDDSFQSLLRAARSASAAVARPASTSDGSGVPGWVWVGIIIFLIALVKDC
jgi:hypothetical protein